MAAPNNGNTNSNDATDENDQHDGQLLGPPPYTLVPTSSIEVHKKLVAALDELQKHGVDHPHAGHVVLLIATR